LIRLDLLSILPCAEGIAAALSLEERRQSLHKNDLTPYEVVSFVVEAAIATQSMAAEESGVGENSDANFSQYGAMPTMHKQG